MLRLRFIWVLIVLLYSISSFMCESPNASYKPAEFIQDTTSQNFSFQAFSFGDGQETGLLNDVWIFNRNNIWAVGIVSSDLEPASNILHWNGKEWERISSLYNETGFESVWALDSSHIYFAAGDIARYIDGKFEVMNTSLTLERGQAINLLWGSSETNIYAAGPYGTLLHFNGISWEKISFDKSWFFYKLTGSNSSGTAYALARNMSNQTLIVKLDNTSAKVIYNSSSSDSPLSAGTITLVSEKELYAAGEKIWKLNTENMQTEVLYNPPAEINFEQSYSLAPNDIYFLGNDNSGSVLIHYNGIRFSRFTLPESFDINGDVFALKNIAVSVGSAENRASIIEIVRN